MLTVIVSKAALFVIGGICYYLSLTPPIPPPTTSDKLYKGQLFEHFVRPITLFSKSILLFAYCWEAFFLLLAAVPTLAHNPLGISVHDVCPHDKPNPQRMATFSSVFCLGLTITVLAFILRYRCFRELKDLFTFEVTIRPEHRLVTSGPYGVVRHPSYVAVLGNMAGAVLTHLAPGGWSRECGGMETPVRWIVWFYFFMCAFTLLSLMKRSTVEDRAMERTFGEEWKVYSGRVPYRFIPRVL